MSLDKWIAFQPARSVTTGSEQLELFESLYVQYSRTVRSILLRIIGQEACDDLAQEVFLRVWKGLPRLRQPESLSSWIYKITINVAYDNIKRIARERRNLTRYSADYAVFQQESAHQAGDFREAIERGLFLLSFAHRTVLVMHDLEGVSEKEIAFSLGIPVGTVKSRLFHARNQMRIFLKKEGIEYREQ